MDASLFSKNFSFRIFHYTENRFVDNTKGVETHFIGYLRQGRGRLVSAEKVTELCAGDLFYIPYGCRYRSYWYAEPECLLDSYAFLQIPERIAYDHQAVYMNEKARYFLTELAANKTVSCYSVSCLYGLFSQMLPHMEALPLDKEEQTLQKALRYITNNPRFLMRDLARHCNVSESGLYALFKKKRGKTPITCKNEIMAKQARFLLSTTSLGIEEIAYRTGYISLPHFRKVIFEVYGKTPLALRKEDAQSI